MSSAWVTIEKASELTGLPASFFHERTSLSGVWPESQVWKWFAGRKLINMAALNAMIDKTPSVASGRGRRRSHASCPQEHPASPA